MLKTKQKNTLEGPLCTAGSGMSILALFLRCWLHEYFSAATVTPCCTTCYCWYTKCVFTNVLNIASQPSDRAKASIFSFFLSLLLPFVQFHFMQEIEMIFFQSRYLPAKAELSYPRKFGELQDSVRRAHHISDTNYSFNRKIESLLTVFLLSK